MRTLHERVHDLREKITVQNEKNKNKTCSISMSDKLLKMVFGAETNQKVLVIGGFSTWYCSDKQDAKGKTI